MAITRTAWVDSDGSPGSGTILNNAAKVELYDQIDARWSEFSSSATGTVNDWDFSQADLIRCTNASLRTINGLLAPASPAKPAKPLAILALGTGQVDLVNQAAGSAAANRIATNLSGPLSLMPYGGAILRYSVTDGRWFVVEHEQGPWIPVAHAAGNFTASSGTWTVAAGDQSFYRYRLKGRTLQINLEIVTSTLSVNGAFPRVALPGGFTAMASCTAQAIRATDTGPAVTTGVAIITNGISYVEFRSTMAGAGFTNTADVVGIQALLTIEI